MISSSLRRAAALAAGLLVVVLAPQAAQAAADPVVSITNPVTSPVWGIQSIAVSATPGDGQTVDRVEISLDGSLFATLTPGAGLTCDAETLECTGSAPWTATTQGLVEITAGLYVDGGLTPAITDTRSITVAAPDPTVAFTTPGATTGLAGVIDLEVTATTDALQTSNAPTGVALLVGDSFATAVEVDSATCAGPPDNVCIRTLSFDSTGIVGTRTFWATATTISGAAEPDSVSLTFANPAPSVAITTPGGVVGASTVEIAVTSSTEVGQTDEPATLTLYEDGVQVGDPFTCAGGSQTCTHTFTWPVPLDVADADYTLTAKVVTDLPREATSTGVVLSAPAPIVTITSPLDGGTVRGPDSDVEVTASTAAFLTDKPSSVQLQADGSDVGSAATCTGHLAGNVCTLTLPWSQAISGDYALTATATTTGGASATTAAATDVVLDNPPTVAITSPTTGATVAGTIDVDITAATDAGATDLPASIQLEVDGDPVGDPLTCTGNLVGATCTVTTTLDTTTLPSTFALTATVTTDSSPADNATSDPVTVGADVPTVAITTTYPAPVGGVVDADVEAATGDDSPDFPDYVEVYATPDGGSETLIGTVECDDAAHACSGSVTWDTTGLDGDYTLVAKVVTVGSASNASFTVPSGPVAVTVETPAPVAAITTAFTGSQKGRITVGVSGSTDSSTSDFPATVTLYREAGATDVLVGALSDCAADVHVCSGDIEFDATTLADADYTLYAVVDTTGSAVTGSATASTTSAPVVVSVANPAPDVVLSPAPPSSVVGQVSIAVTATTDPALTEYPATITVTVNGSTIGTVTCAAEVHSCSGSVPWDTTTLSPNTGVSRTIAAQVTSTLSDTDPTPPSAVVSLANPAMKAAVTSPATNAVIKTSPTGITVKAWTTSPQTDRPRLISVTVAGRTLSATCSAWTYECTKTLSFSTSSWVGQRTVAVTVKSARQGAPDTYTRTATATRTVYGYSGTRVVITSPSTVTAGSTVTLRGKVTSTKTGLGIGGVTVRITRNPALGSTTSSTVTTSSSGAWSLRWTAGTNTAITAAVVAKRTPNGTIYIASSSRSATQPVRAAMRCSVSTPSLSPGQRGSGSCSVPNLPAGTPLALRYIFNGTLTTLAQGTSKSTSIPFSFTFNARGTYYLRIDLSANSRFVATSSALLPVTVR